LAIPNARMAHSANLKAQNLKLKAPAYAEALTGRQSSKQGRHA